MIRSFAPASRSARSSDAGGPLSESCSSMRVPLVRICDVEAQRTQPQRFEVIWRSTLLPIRAILL